MRRPFLPVLPAVRNRAETIGELLLSDHEGLTASQDFNNDLRHFAVDRLFRRASTADEVEGINEWSGLLSDFYDPLVEPEDCELLHSPDVDDWLDIIARAIESANERDLSGEHVPCLHAVEFSTSVTGRFRFLSGLGVVPFRSFKQFLKDIKDGKFQVFLSDVTGSQIEYFAYENLEGRNFFGPLIFTAGDDFDGDETIEEFMATYAPNRA